MNRYSIALCLALTVFGCGRSEHTSGPDAGVEVKPVRQAVEETMPTTASPIVSAARMQVGVTVTYDPGYVSLSYPGGDLPREKGVCSDVVIRALRDALNMDLQQLVHEDMKAAFSEYPKIWRLTKPDRNIDHRRVPNLMTYFKRKGYSMDVTRNAEDYIPGDLVTCTVGRNLPHIMVVSDKKTRGGVPLVIHNIGAGAQEEDRLFSFDITGHYRIKNSNGGGQQVVVQQTRPRAVESAPSPTARTIHVFVALCDNEKQGIVPVPAKLGNGEDPGNNLYWGAMYGTKSFLKKSSSWKYLGEKPVPTGDVLQRIVFRHTAGKAYLVADAYRGGRIQQAMTDLLSSAGGNNGATLKIESDLLGLNGNADLVVYVGHNGLMNVDVAKQKRAASGRTVPAMVFACKSKPYFEPRLVALGSSPVLLTTGFMAPEAYTLDAAVCAWISGQAGETIRERAAAAYNEYQKCGINGARRLFYSGL